MAFSSLDNLSINVDRSNIFITESLNTFCRFNNDIYIFNKDIKDFELFIEDFYINADYTDNNRANFYNKKDSDILYITHQNYVNSSVNYFYIDVININTKEIISTNRINISSGNDVFLQFSNKNGRFINLFRKQIGSDNIIFERYDSIFNFSEQDNYINIGSGYKFRFYFLDENEDIVFYTYNESTSSYKIYKIDNISFIAYEIDEYNNISNKILDKKVIDFFYKNGINRNNLIYIDNKNILFNNGLQEDDPLSYYSVSSGMKFNIVDNKDYTVYLDNELDSINFSNSGLDFTFPDSDGYIYHTDGNTLYKNDLNIYEVFDLIDGDGDSDEESEKMYYGNIEKAENYFKERNTQAYDYFTQLTEQEKINLLLNATTIVDSNNFIGYKKDTEQFKQFPRLYDRKVELTTPIYEWHLGGGYDIKYYDTITKELDITLIEQATYETAYALSITKSLNSTNEEIEGIQTERLDGVGSFTYFESQALKEKSGYDLMPLVAKMYIKRYLRNNKSRSSIETRLGVQF